MRFVSVCVLASALAACGSSSGSFDGTVAGNKLSVEDAVFVNTSAESGDFISVVLADVADICDLMKANKQPKEATALTLRLMTFADAATLTTVAPGTFNVAASPTMGDNFASAFFTKTDASCEDTLTGFAGTATAGSVELTSITVSADGKAEGTFDLTFGSDRGKGDFSATYCEIPTTTATPTCE